MRQHESEIRLDNSSPCIDCFNKMDSLGVKTIVYSGLKGEILKQKMIDYTPKIMTIGREFIMNGFKRVNKNKKTSSSSSFSSCCSSSSSSSSCCSSESDSLSENTITKKMRC